MEGQPQDQSLSGEGTSWWTPAIAVPPAGVDRLIGALGGMFCVVNNSGVGNQHAEEENELHADYHVNEDFDTASETSIAPLEPLEGADGTMLRFSADEAPRSQSTCVADGRASASAMNFSLLFSAEADLSSRGRGFECKRSHYPVTDEMLSACSDATAGGSSDARFCALQMLQDMKLWREERKAERRRRSVAPSNASRRGKFAHQPSVGTWLCHRRQGKVEGK